jgi:c-di-GMP-binding flagellar brake protein YcgR
MKIICVALNPAMDKTIYVNNFKLGRVNIIDDIHYEVGGRGINIAKVLNNFEIKSIVTGFVGGVWAEPFRVKLMKMGIETKFFKLLHDTRVNTKLIDKESGECTTISEKGPFVPEELLERFIQSFTIMCKEDDIIILAGGMLPGIKEDILKTVKEYKDSLLSDINLSLRVTYDKNTYITKIVDWQEDIITFFAPMDKTDWVILPHAVTLDLCFISKKALYMTTIQILGKYTSKQKLYYNAVISSPLEKKQQRQYFRLDVLMNVNYKVLPEDISSVDLNTLEFHRGTTVNISVGGLCLVSDQKMNRGDKLYMEFKFLDTDFQLMGELLNIGEQNNVGTYNHRVQFISLSRREENLLSTLIFKKQRLLMTQNNIPIIR